MQVKAVFDIGKTNKKFLLFDENFDTVFEQRTTLEQAEDEDGDPCEDLERLVDWAGSKFNRAAADERFEIVSLNISTYGASLVHLDKNGETVTPLYDYLKPFPDYLEDKFYVQYGDKERFALETASPPMGMLNSGLQLYWLKYEKPEYFRKIEYTLHFPQYLSYLFTGEIGAEYTSIGCHTGMWDFRKNDYHDWLEKEGMTGLLPSVQPVGTTYGVSKAGERFKTGMGIHDSSAALVPYLYLFEEPFILISTGTWSISLNPFNKEPLTFDELRKDCLCYMNIYGKQVKAARFFLGNEYDYQKSRLNNFFNRESPYTEVETDLQILSGLIKKDAPDRRLILETAHNSGPYPNENPGVWNLDNFSSFEEAYHQLMLDLVSIQADSIQLAQGSEPVDTLIITGGFSKNDLYVKLLASRFPDKNVFTARQPNASALGAAMVVEDNLTFDNKALKELLDLTQHEPLPDIDIESYSWNAYPSDRSKRSDG